MHTGVNVFDGWFVANNAPLGADAGARDWIVVSLVLLGFLDIIVE